MGGDIAFDHADAAWPAKSLGGALRGADRWMVMPSTLRVIASWY
jgi:hypothetical protein